MILQVEHIVEKHFAQAESDLGERELELASGIECDLETFFATIALTKSVLESILNEDGMSISPHVVQEGLTVWPCKI